MMSATGSDADREKQSKETDAREHLPVGPVRSAAFSRVQTPSKHVYILAKCLPDISRASRLSGTATSPGCNTNAVRALVLSLPCSVRARALLTATTRTANAASASSKGTYHHRTCARHILCRLCTYAIKHKMGHQWLQVSLATPSPVSTASSSSSASISFPFSWSSPSSSSSSSSSCSSSSCSPSSSSTTAYLPQPASSGARLGVCAGRLLLKSPLEIVRLQERSSSRVPAGKSSRVPAVI
eukprot:GHVU01052549.1.p1 GENE.GHVU01052549.1~~GHVU01052549.1.p1  ORF type:complete len:241 (-),score=27.52 GHVU01052549.1:680-1402(-)